MSCHACERIEQIRKRENPRFITELSESYVVLADEQGYPGWCVLLLKDHQEHLAGLPLQRQANLWRDVSLVAAAITRELQPIRINYDCLGNQLHHIHWHVVPRYADDPQPTQPIWLRNPAERRGSLSPEQEKSLITRLSAAIAASRT